MGVKSKNASGRYWTEVIDAVNEAYGDRADNLTYGGYNNHYGWVNRPGWFAEIRRGLYQSLEWDRTTNTPLTRCQTCGFIMSPQAVQIDHIVPWNMYLDGFRHPGSPMTNLEARLLYNDPANLRAICALCNGAHPEARAPAGNTRGAFERAAAQRIDFLVGLRLNDGDD
ncbi:HNH endonuclease [Vibrio sp. Isolate23]|uniref:HNH endonuclease n=1 Tax=Vibrio sp. Isolate23 TaxID=2908533 RepID=UPI001EFD584F|nr:HNH endonuclease signature motif containing protein [Vibrio sp. Isolate23]MCG9685270.1 HNH endonuclease [Vibrio sp. Isolate23]